MYIRKVFNESFLAKKIAIESIKICKEDLSKVLGAGLSIFFSNVYKNDSSKRNIFI